jgi:DNA polymerase-1
VASGFVALLLDDTLAQMIPSPPQVMAYWGTGQWAVLNQETRQLVWQDQSCTKIIHDFKKWISCEFLDLTQNTHGPKDDLVILSYVLHGSRHGHDLPSIFHQAGWPKETQKTWSPQQTACAMAQVWEHNLIQLRQKRLLRTYYGIDRPVMNVLAKMEHRGIPIDAPGLNNLDQVWTKELGLLSEEITVLAGQNVNPASPKQLGKVLFEDLGWPNGKKGKSGTYQTDSDVLTHFAKQGYPLAKTLLDWRQLSKLINTYVKGLRDHINPTTQRIHTTYSLTSTSTGRLSSLEPNLQNIPIRTQRGRLLRHQFRASPGYGFLCLDYSQIELRLLAHMGPIPSLQQAFRAHQDIHTQTAAHLFGCPPEHVTGDMRRTAKGINFGILYGISAFGLAEHLGIDRVLAKTMIRDYFATYPEIEEYLERTKASARQNGYVTTLWGRRCIIPGITSSHAGVRASAERQAINAPLQGTSADIIKRAMIHIDAFLTRVSGLVPDGENGNPFDQASIAHPNSLDCLATIAPEDGTGLWHTANGLSFENREQKDTTRDTEQAQSAPWDPALLAAETSAALESPQDVALLLQIHDELVFQVRCQDATALGNMLVPMMAHVAQLSVPLLVTSSFGQTLDQ